VQHCLAFIFWWRLELVMLLELLWQIFSQAPLS
jgi:hypothetical protein